MELQHQSFQGIFSLTFLLGLTGLISLQSKGLSTVFSSTIPKQQFFSAQSSLCSNSHICTQLEKTIALTIGIFVSTVMSLLFNMLSSFVIAFLPRSRCLLILWLQSLSAVILEPKNINSATIFTFSTSICKLNKMKIQRNIQQVMQYSKNPPD